MSADSLATIVNRIFGSGWSFVRGFTTTHHGVDISAGQGQPIPSLASGTVVYSAFSGGGGDGYVNSYSPPTDAGKAAQFATTGGGNVVVVQGTDGLFYHYAHLNNADVHVGDTVQRGTTIGTVGHTGDATGNHLHFAIRNANGWVDPTSFLTSINSTVGTGIPATSGSDPLGWVPDIGGAITGVGILLVGVGLIIAAALISRNSQK
jgi:murein DD-endopeptidase MepM/ murein hydrolase activator NlpD